MFTLTVGVPDIVGLTTFSKDDLVEKGGDPSDGIITLELSNITGFTDIVWRYNGEEIGTDNEYVLDMNDLLGDLINLLIVGTHTISVEAKDSAGKFVSGFVLLVVTD